MTFAPSIKLPFLALAIVVMVITAGCLGTQNIDSQVEGGVVYSQVSPSDHCQITDYGNNVLFFGCVGSGFANGLSQYISKNPNISVSSIAPVPNPNAYNSISGYIVVFQEADL